MSTLSDCRIKPFGLKRRRRHKKKKKTIFGGISDVDRYGQIAPQNVKTDFQQLIYAFSSPYSLVGFWFSLKNKIQTQILIYASVEENCFKMDTSF